MDQYGRVSTTSMCDRYGHSWLSDYTCSRCGTTHPSRGKKQCDTWGHSFTSGGTCARYDCTAKDTRTECERNGHDYNEGGVCPRCGDYDEDYDEDFEDEDEDEDDDEDEDEEDDNAGEVKSWNGQKYGFHAPERWLARAKELLRERKIFMVEEVFQIAEILEREMERRPYDSSVAKLVVVAFRETESEREVWAAMKAAADKAAEPEPAPEPTIAVSVRKGQRKKVSTDR